MVGVPRLVRLILGAHDGSARGRLRALEPRSLRHPDSRPVLPLLIHTLWASNSELISLTHALIVCVPRFCATSRSPTAASQDAWVLFRICRVGASRRRRFSKSDSWVGSSYHFALGDRPQRQSNSTCGERNPRAQSDQRLHTTRPAFAQVNQPTVRAPVASRGLSSDDAHPSELLLEPLLDLPRASPGGRLALDVADVRGGRVLQPAVQLAVQAHEGHVLPARRAGGAQRGAKGIGISAVLARRGGEGGREGRKETHLRRCRIGHRSLAPSPT